MAPRFLPITVPTWAEDEDFPVGVHPWSGAPNKVEIVEAQRDVGQQPDSQIAGVHYNWLNHRYSRGYEAYFHDCMQRWVGSVIHVVADVLVDVTTYTLQSLLFVGDTIGICPPNYTEKAAPAVPLLMLAGADTPTIAVTTSGHQFTDVEHIADSAIVDIVGFPGVQLAIRADQRHVYRSVNFGESWAEIANVTVADSIIAHLLISGDRVLAAISGTGDADGLRVYVSDDFGATWDPVDIGGSVYTITSWASNQDDIIVAYATNSGFGGFDTILYSTDNGDTWLVGDLAGDAFQNASVAYSSEWGQFMVINAEGKIWTTADGAGFVERSGMGFLPRNTKSLAGLGPVFAMVTNPALTPSPDSRHASGVVYSIDCGVNWFFVPLGIIDPSGDGIQTIKAWGGRFVAGAKHRLYMSGNMWMPEPDEVIV